MSKILFISIILTSIFLQSSSAETLQCNFTITQWLYYPSREYLAFVTNQEIFNITPITIDNIEGHHLIGHFNNDVRGIDIHNATKMVKFPRNIDKFFKNLILIGIFDSRLDEIQQSDLMVFPHLRHLYLSHNRIRVIHDNLFKFNARLEVVSLYNNEIIHIDPRSFSELNMLKMLYLGLNICSLGNARSRNEVLLLLERIEYGNCTSDDFVTIWTENPLRLELRQVKDENYRLQNNLNMKVKEIEELNDNVQKLIQKTSTLMSENQKLELKIAELNKISTSFDNFTAIIKAKDAEINKLKTDLIEKNKKLKNDGRRNLNNQV